MRAAIAFAAALTLGACTLPAAPRPAAVGGPVMEPPAPVPAWRAALAADDAARLDRLPATWAAARSAALPRYRRAVDAAGALLRADAALEHPALPPGSYDCRLTVLGRARDRRETYARRAPFFCYVRGEAGGELSFTKQTGSDLPGGWLHPDGTRRHVFVGARQRQAGDASLAYGSDPTRDLVGVVERIGAFRWRLVLPSRTGDAALDVYELTPVPVDRQGAAPPEG